MLRFGCRVWRTARVALLAGALVAGHADSLHSHGGRVPLDEWGGFEAEASRCQRAIGYAASYCASRSWRLREQCRSSQAGGGTCDESRTTSRIARARTEALDYVDRYCGERQAQDLAYLGTFDLQTDLIDFCRAWERSAESAVYGPFLRGEIGSPPPASAAACLDAAAAATTRLMSFTFETRRRAMDRMAVLSLSEDDEVGLYDDATRRIERSRELLADDFGPTCQESNFELLYGKQPRVFLDDIGIRADCIGAQFYIQDRFLCPDGVCGNGVIEPGETCDDGDRWGGDGCDANCRAVR
jgi:cysteine-rich repeat protein